MRRVAARIARVDWMMIFPVAAAVAWFLGEAAMAAAMVIVLPLCVALDLHGRPTAREARPSKGDHQPVTSATVEDVIDNILEDCTRSSRTTAILRVEIRDLQMADGGWGMGADDTVMTRLTQRTAAAMRGHDRVLRLGERGMVAVLGPTRRADLDVLMAIVDRVQAAIAEPISIDGRPLRVRCSIGVCAEAMAPGRSGADILAAAGCALDIARREGDDAVRVFNSDVRCQFEIDQTLADQIDKALIDGQIRPWFQPQVDTRTGTLAGFEALARWHHPDLGVLLPDQFLSAIAAAGRSADLGEVILRQSILALTDWDKAGIDVPCVGVNVSLEQLSDPRLAERIIWQIDRYDLEPRRIAIEIAETVTLHDDDETIVRNVTALRSAGFRLDLDDFGTGAASIAHVAQFGVHRIKIDRSFIHEIDTSAKKRQVVAAILALADGLAIDTLAQGVETAEEQLTLAEMGCPHVQGFGIARPMVFAETIAWAMARPVLDTQVLHRLRPGGSA